MSLSTFSYDLVRHASHAGEIFGAKMQSGQRLALAAEWLALIIAWSAVLAMSLAIVGLLLGEQ